MLRFGVRNSKPEAQSGRKYRFTRPQVSRQFTWVTTAPRQHQVIHHTLDHFFFAPPVGIQSNTLWRDKRYIIALRTKLRQQELNVPCRTTCHCALKQLSAGMAIKLG